MYWIVAAIGFLSFCFFVFSLCRIAALSDAAIEEALRGEDYEDPH
jgi:hypothetical protein